MGLPEIATSTGSLLSNAEQHFQPLGKEPEQTRIQHIGAMLGH
ncbi:MAG TPA: hypothetical protein VFL96_10810 [Acidobacteriaceae bacterium]|jgi:hypothetical protein|nr:hypothetical protein [Acidobacteriaceae bacterium]